MKDARGPSRRALRQVEQEESGYKLTLVAVE